MSCMRAYRQVKEVKSGQNTSTVVTWLDFIGQNKVTRATNMKQTVMRQTPGGALTSLQMHIQLPDSQREILQ